MVLPSTTFYIYYVKTNNEKKPYGMLLFVEINLNTNVLLLNEQ